jgi:hypothetical protein
MDEAKLGWLFGFYLLTGLFVLEAIISLGDVKAETSFGSKELIETIKTLLVFWAGWKFKDVTGNKA